MRSRQEQWRELQRLLQSAHGRPERLGADGVRRLGALYRGAVADLARARRSFPGDPIVRSLEDLVGSARAAIYAVQPRRGSASDYFARGYWRAVREQRLSIAIALVLLAVSTVLATIWGWHDPRAAAGVVPGSLGAGGPPHRAIGLGADQSAAFSISIFVNNIRVTFFSFAAGITLGLGTAALLLYNGLVLGAVVGIQSHGGHTLDAIELIVPHGLLELSCVAVGGAAGMRIGWALVEPGPLPRVEALRREALRSVAVVLATAPWLVLAGLIEGFVTPRHLPLAPALLIGVGLAAAYWSLALSVGRRAAPAEDPHSRSSDFARR